MTAPFEISQGLKKTLHKLGKKDQALAIQVRKKIHQIASTINIDDHFKNLKHDLSHLKRIQIGSFVLTFKVKGNLIIFEDFDHHDRIYKKDS